MSKDERKAMQAYKAMMQDINEDLNREIEVYNVYMYIHLYMYIYIYKLMKL
jgi:hypothetical protein